MDPKIVDGKAIAEKRQQALIEKVSVLQVKPKVVSILIGDDPPSVLYVGLKQKKAHQIGIEFEIKQFPDNISYNSISKLISDLNQDANVTGIMIQLPLPKIFLQGRQTKDLLSQISLVKDVDGLRLDSSFLPAAVKAVTIILEEEKIEVIDKKCVVIGSSDLLGKPIARELTKLGGNVEICDSRTIDLSGQTRKADILVSATGVAGLITGQMVKEGVIIIDVGVMVIESLFSEASRDKQGKVLGDVDFASVAPKAFKITPVPGGVGPITVISLMENVVKAKQLQD